MNEETFIEKYLQPLSKNFKDAINLTDDAAILKKYNSENYIISTDTFINGIHCPDWVNVKFAIMRAILIAVSDLAAMAAKPYCIFLSASFPRDEYKSFFKDFRDGLNQGLLMTGMKLAGGDICTHKGPVMFCITAVGLRKKKYVLKRSGAMPGEKLCVTGNIGEAKIGLDILLKEKKITKNLFLNRSVKKFLSPPIRLKFSQQISSYVTSCIDISDGLITDSAKLAKNSKCALNIYSDKIPLSSMAKKEIKKNNYKLKDLISAGDDYELAFSVKEQNLNFIETYLDGEKILKTFNSVFKGE